MKKPVVFQLTTDWIEKEIIVFFSIFTAKMQWLSVPTPLMLTSSFDFAIFYIEVNSFYPSLGKSIRMSGVRSTLCLTTISVFPGALTGRSNFYCCLLKLYPTSCYFRISRKYWNGCFWLHGVCFKQECDKVGSVRGVTLHTFSETVGNSLVCR